MRLKILRKQRGLSQLKLAMDLNMNQNSISRYENGEREADYATLIKFADYFNVSLDYMVGRTDIKEMVEKTKMSDLTDKETLLIKLFRTLNEKQKDCIISLIDSYENR